jgi:hypothetical protein
MGLRHEPSCTCDLCVAYRAAMRQNADPLMRKKVPEPTRNLIPRSEAIAMAKDELGFHLSRAGELRAELERLGDMQ